MKKLLLHFDTDPIPSSFDAVVAYDSGADHLIQYAGVTEENCAGLVEGAIYTRGPKNKKDTAIFISGSDLHAGQKLFKAVQDVFFSNFRVSIMLDSNGCNTTAAAAVALLNSHFPVKDKVAVVLAGTGPVGQRAAAMMMQCGARRVFLSSRKFKQAQQSCNAIAEQFGAQLTPIECGNDDQIKDALQNAEIAVATGKTGIQLVKYSQWNTLENLKAVADVNTRPPTGFEGIETSDSAVQRDGKLVFGGLGVGSLKLKLQRTCIGSLFNDNGQVLDMESVLAIAEELVKR